MSDQAEKLRKIIDSLKLRQAEAQINLQKGIKRTGSRVIAITSGKGGVGKTNIAINLAIALSEMGYRVIILDADLGLANIDVLFGIVPKFTLVDVIQNRKNIFDVLTDGPCNIKFISGGSGVEELINLDNYRLARFINDIALLDKLSDIVLIDTGAGLSETVMSFILAADEALLITTPEPSSITDAYALIKMVSNRDKSKPIKILVNRAENVNEANDILNRLVMVANKFLSVRLQPSGYILNDEMVVKAVKMQQPFSISFPKCTAAKNIREISKRLVEADIETNNGMSGLKGFIHKLVGYMNT